MITLVFNVLLEWRYRQQKQLIIKIWSPPDPTDQALHLVQMLHRLNVVLLSPENVINASNHKHAAKHDHAPVHVCHGGRVDDGEETCNAGYGHVEDREKVDRDAEFSEREA
jgi:hypothetical protein